MGLDGEESWLKRLGLGIAVREELGEEVSCVGVHGDEGYGEEKLVRRLFRVEVRPLDPGDEIYQRMERAERDCRNAESGRNVSQMSGLLGPARVGERGLNPIFLAIELARIADEQHQIEWARTAEIQKRERRKCGFRSFPDIVEVDRKCRQLAVRLNKGLYGTAIANAVPSVDAQRAFYAEVEVVLQIGGRGICVGWVTRDDTPTKLCGSVDRSVGYFSDGRLLIGNKWVAFGEPYEEGDRIGCLLMKAAVDRACKQTTRILNSCEFTPSPGLTLPQVLEDGILTTDKPSPTRVDSGGEEMGLVAGFYLNGGVQGYVLLEDSNVFLGASLYSAGSAVRLRCCAEDWFYGHMLGLSDPDEICHPPPSKIPSRQPIKYEPWSRIDGILNATTAS
uniref:B30.2/SPRY domain-containing protein n=1 Tax=Compsopogon caeruleus TaxID=31354 RepID=A0A6T6CC18_9RHOD|mmetsp:Transcript_5458/g.11108  ORF Transcript_5458/g.11108 Transcript_5458/m.11108 type:complete len:392 (+) Transcript_5458:264-1439(+)|eukprot:CAMPEP_0184686824 /NCGR_PEP_ID=MMETSP0312-20130426/24161_1 /TAXON_ID=31354 /ORGANISM="Compsopogon coeruleus, Strain SAG 36.94" /LENGTH=391 /DNA_ID=CAMNT_0027142327 /DNA_START=243 /DNA_END=1418 /DNA_ORIENTATION=-